MNKGYDSRIYFWKDPYYLILFLIVLLGFILRVWNLSDRPIHHDESLHGVYSLYYLFDPKTHFYKYDPLLHGPFLYNITPWFFWIFDISKWSLRLPSALIGTLLITTPMLLRKYLTQKTIILISLIIATGPSFIYWSRFLRHDSFVFLSLYLILLSLTTLPKIIKAPIIGLAAGIHFATKENFFIHLLFMITLIIFEKVITYKRGSKYLISSQLKNFFINYRKSFILGLILIFLCGYFFYSAGFVYSKGFLDGLYRKSLFYWFDQHKMERIPGPFSFTFLVNSLYEIWWVPFIGIHLYFFYNKRKRSLLIGFLLSFAPAVIFSFLRLKLPNYSFFYEVLKIKINQDLYLYFPLIYHAITATTLYLRENRPHLAYSMFFFTSSLFTYSFLGEKVPWLALYPLFSGIIFFAFDLNSYINKKALYLFFLVLPKILYNTYWLNYKHPSESKNLLSQVHTTREFENTLHKIRDEMNSFENGHGPNFLAKDGHTWPTTWYFFNRDEYKFHYRPDQISRFKYILTAIDDKDASLLQREGYHFREISYRSWFLPDYQSLSIKDFFYMWLNFSSDSTTGTASLRLYIKD